MASLKQRAIRGVVVLTGALAALGVCAAEFPAVWPSAKPESEGLSTAHLHAFWRDMRRRKTDEFVVIRNDRIVFEGYANGFSRTKVHYTASLAKSLVGGMALMLAMNDGRISPDDLACKYVPQWADVPLRREITVRELASHSSGLSDSDDEDLPVLKTTGWEGDFWKFYRGFKPGRDPFTLSRDYAPMVDRPGAGEHYSNPGFAMLSYCITASLRGAPQQDLRSLLADRLMKPLGVPADEWSVGYGTTVDVDGLPLVASWGGAAYSANATARIGRLLLRHGNWQGRQLISPAVVDEATRYCGEPGAWGLTWWTNVGAGGTVVFPGMPKDAYFGAGAGDQTLLVIPSLGVIVVRYGQSMDWDDNGSYFFVDVGKYIVRDLRGRGPVPPYPASPVIKSVVWAPPATVVRRARGSDNWPVTWGADGALYTAYGDGHGFAPYVPEKLSLGFARVTGGPDRFSGRNVRSHTGEQFGDGPSGKKASGLLMMDGVLYMWVRNAKSSQLAWSFDDGTSWNWSRWTFADYFGCPAFLNFGRNYSGARDGFVYVYSPDMDDAYSSGDQLVLARVPCNRIRDRRAYRFFVRIGPDGQPIWSSDPYVRGGVFVDPGACRRCHVTYDAALKRYLLVMPVGDGETRVGRGLAIYDAPEPWGPWTTAYYTAKWDMAPGESEDIPSKWLGSDGRTMRLVFSGDDDFCVRKSTFVLGARR
ncbi:MAG: serine hydrolase [Opitutaceae bacterium]